MINTLYSESKIQLHENLYFSSETDKNYIDYNN